MSINRATENRLWLCLIAMAFISVACFICSGNIFAEPMTQGDKSEEKILYHDMENQVRIVKKNNFLLKIEKNDKGLDIVEELGPYPEAYPRDLPPPGTHIDNKESEIDRLDDLDDLDDIEKIEGIGGEDHDKS